MATPCPMKWKLKKSGVNEWNEMSAGVDHGMCCLLGLGKVRMMCVIEATKVFLGDGWGRRRMNEEHLHIV